MRRGGSAWASKSSTSGPFHDDSGLAVRRNPPAPTPIARRAVRPPQNQVRPPTATFHAASLAPAPWKTASGSSIVGVHATTRGSSCRARPARRPRPGRAPTWSSPPRCAPRAPRRRRAPRRSCRPRATPRPRRVRPREQSPRRYPVRFLSGPPEGDASGRSLGRKGLRLALRRQGPREARCRRHGRCRPPPQRPGSQAAQPPNRQKRSARFSPSRPRRGHCARCEGRPSPR